MNRWAPQIVLACISAILGLGVWACWQVAKQEEPDG